MITPYEQDIQDQPESLRAFATAPAVAGLEELRQGYDRIVLTGMGTSHFAGLPTWRALARRGWPAWWLDTTQLLDTADLVTPGTLLVVTSQSGRSAEVVALCDGRPRSTLVAVTNDGASPLARAADLVVPLHSGAEATVSTKSYLNSLAAHGVILAALLGQPAGPARAAAAPVADALAAWLDGPDPAVGTAGSRLAMIGVGDQLASALTGALIIQEAAKVPAQAYTAGQFRHGPLELAGPGLTALLFDDPASAANDLGRLHRDLVATGATVIDVALPPAGGPAELPPLGPLVAGAVAVQRFSVGLARAHGVVPGEFRYGSKVTDVR